MMTINHLLKYPERYHRDELASGVLVVREPCGALSGIVATQLARHMTNFVERHTLGLVSTDPVGYILSRKPDTVRCPDVGFIAWNRVPGGETPSGFFDTAPDLAVEVISTNDRIPNVMRKVGEYLAAGTKLVWVIIPLVVPH